MAQLFKNKIIGQKLETFQIEDFQEKLEIVKKWHTDYHTGSLKQDKEISRAPGWTQDFLGEVLGYARKPSENHTYDTEYSVAGQRPDFVLAHFWSTQKWYVIWELKDAKTSLDAPQKREWSITPVQQAFKYKGNLRDSSFVIVSNFFETRLYYDNYLDYEMWTLDTLVDPKNDYFQLRKFIFLLSEWNLIAKRWESNTKSLISLIQTQQKEITKGFYKEYSLLRKELFKDIIVQAKKVGKPYKQSELDMILSKTQKIIDRIIFIHFCEDLDLLPQWKLKENLLRAEEIGFSPWEMLKKFFEFVNSWSERLGIPDGYNGGLFHKDEVLESLEIWDEICKKFVDLWDYDFEDDLSVNILGHIFEQSISDIEELKDKIQKNEEVALSKRKKDWVFYTPEYIVDYIVKNSVGKKIEDWEQELREKHKLKEDITDKNYTKRAISVYSELQEKLQNITVLDPACGSGAFLVNVFDFLLAKNQEISKTLEDLWVNQGFFSTESHFKSILQNNIYWVDLNEESVEITKLSLWLKTAIKWKKLANLDSNIKCWNSLIDDKQIAWDKAFSWESEFPQIFKKKQLQAHHITWVTHNSRTSERMKQYKVEKGEWVYLDSEAELLITWYIADIVQADNIPVLAYNICADHVHILLVCAQEEIPDIVRRLKWKSAYMYNKGVNPLVEDEDPNYSDGTKYHLWAQKYHSEEIISDEQLANTIEYIENNREKHELPVNKGVHPLVKKMCCTYEAAFQSQYTWGFDVIVGNPPYVVVKKDNPITRFYNWNDDLYLMFFEKTMKFLLEKEWILWFITPRFFLVNKWNQKFREYILNDINLYQLVETSPFEDAQTECVISIFNKKDLSEKIKVFEDRNSLIEIKSHILKEVCKKNNDSLINTSLTTEKNFIIEKILKNTLQIWELSISKRWMELWKPFLRETLQWASTMIWQDTWKYSFIFEDTFVPKDHKEYLRLKDFFEWEKIYLRRVAKDLICYIWNDFAYNKNIYWIKISNGNYNIKYIATLLNSSILSFYYKAKFSTKKWDLFPEIQTYLYNQLPIKNIPPSEQTPFIEKADFMLENNKIMWEKVQKFLKRVQGTFQLEKLSKKLQAFYELSFEEFVRELWKMKTCSSTSPARTEQGVSTPCWTKVKLSLKDQDEWEEYFDSYKSGIVELKTKIDQCDREIDEMVFDLYGLSEEEREVVINS